MPKIETEVNINNYKKLLELLIACTDVVSLNDAIETFYDFYTNNGTTIPKKLKKTDNISDEEKYKNLLKIIETGIKEKGLENVYDKLFNFYLKNNVFPRLNSNGRTIIFDELFNVVELTKGVYKSFVDLNLYINSKGATEPINFDSILLQFLRLLKIIKKTKGVLLNYNRKDEKLYIATLDFVIFFEDLLNIEIELTKKLSTKAKGGKYGYFQYRKDAKKRNSANMKVGEYFDRLQIEEINKISYDIISDALKVSKDIEAFLKIFGLENEVKKHKNSFIDAVIYFCIYYNVLALHKSKKYEKEIIEIINVATLEAFSNQTNTDFNKNSKKYSYIKANLDDLPNSQNFKEADPFLLSCETFFIWAFDNELDTNIFTDKEYEKILTTIRTAFTNIVEQLINE